MLATRIIPTLLCRRRQLIKGKQFQSWRSVGVVAQAVRVFQSRGGDELILLDISATPEGKTPDLKLIEELADVCFMPLAVGGGIRTVEQAQDLLRVGADKVVIGQALYKDPYLATKINEKMGAQAVIVAIDTKDGQVCTEGGTQTQQVDAQAYAVVLETMGVGEIMVTSVEREGTMEGYDLQTIKTVADAVSIPVIAHGGAGTYQHMAQAVVAGASAVAAGAMYQFKEATPKAAAEFLHEQGIEARL